MIYNFQGVTWRVALKDLSLTECLNIEYLTLLLTLILTLLRNLDLKYYFGGENFETQYNLEN